MTKRNEWEKGKLKLQVFYNRQEYYSQNMYAYVVIVIYVYIM